MQPDTGTSANDKIYETNVSEVSCTWTNEIEDISHKKAYRMHSCPALLTKRDPDRPEYILQPF
jgi:hypothetical protein